jgi:outer membrane receptor for ferrienterochelin and colicin
MNMRRTRVSTILLASLFLTTAALAQDESEDEGEEIAVEPAEGDKPAEEPAEEEEAVEEDEEGLDPSRPAPAGKCVIWGKLTDARGEPIIEAEVSVIGTSIKTITDYDGFYRLEVPACKYDLRFWAELQKPTQLTGIAVTTGEVYRQDEKLAPVEGAVDVIEVETEQESSSAEGQILERKRSASVGDSVGRAEMSKQADRSAADSAKRVVGITVEDSRFVFIRGLGERYTNALLDGAPLPSPEPDRQAVPFDLFPSLMLDGLTVAKTFTPDYPGDFAGGSVRIVTRRIPDEFLFSVSLNAGVNSQSTFREGLSYHGSSMDWLGIDGGVRALDPSIPEYKIGRGLKHPDGRFISPDELKGYGQSVNAFMSTERTVYPIDHGGNVVIGHSVALGEESKLGFMGAFSYGRKFELYPDEIIRTFRVETDGGLKRLNDLGVERGIDKVSWGGLGGVTLEIDKHQRIHLTGLYSRSSDNTATELEGRHEERGAIIHETRLSFVSRSLAFGQLRGEHEIEQLNDAELDWNLSLARAERYEPDTRATVFVLDSALGAYNYEDDSQSGLHFFSEQGETTFGGGLNYKQPLVTGPAPTYLKFGSLVSLRSREFNARRFTFQPANGVSPDSRLCHTTTWDATCPDQIFAQENIGTNLELVESTRPNDAYTADLNIFSGYVMIDSSVTDTMRLILGERLEVSDQTIDSIDPHNPEVGAVSSGYTNRDFLPAAALVWGTTSTSNLRLSATRTLARPQLREIAPFSFTDYFGGREVQGNPDLELTHIYNFDLRFEWFPTLREVLAASVFYKRFSDPIEEVIQAAGARGIVTFQNAESADLFGVELEARKSLDFIVPELADLSIVSNLTFARSRVDLDPEEAAFVTNPNRPLSRQAPYIANVALDYSNEDTGTRLRLSYNIAGPRIVAVGTKGLPDVYGQPRHQLDFVGSQELFEGFEIKASAKNLINDSFRETQGEDDEEDAVVHSYTTGVTVNLGLTYTY